MSQTNGPSPSTAHGIYNATPPTMVDQQPGPIQLDVNGNIKVAIASGSGGSTTTLSQGAKVVAATGTPERLVASPTLVRSVTLWGYSGQGVLNATVVYVGSASADGDNQSVLSPGGFLSIEAPFGESIDLNAIYLDVTTNSDGATWTAES